MTEVDPIRIECPGCHRKFRLRSRPKDANRRTVKCPKCGTAIPLPKASGNPPPPTPNAPRSSSDEPRASAPSDETQEEDALPTTRTSDKDLRAMLRKVKRKQSTSDSTAARRGSDDPDPAESDITQPTLDLPDKTRPDHPSVPMPSPEQNPGAEVGEATMPIGQMAFTADELGTSDDARRSGGGGGRHGRQSKRQRVDTPRAGAQMANLSRPSRARPEPPEGATPPPKVEEPTYTGPVPGRTPKITPTDHELERFLKPGNYMVRVEDIVYAPVTERALADIVDAGVILGVDEIADEDGMWSAIDTGDLLGGIKARLSHRAHHILSRVAEKTPASEYGRPPAALPQTETPAPQGPDAGPANEAGRTNEMAQQPMNEGPDGARATKSATELNVAKTGAMPQESASPPPKKKRRWLLLPLALLLLGAVGAGAAWLAAPDAVEQWVTRIANREDVRSLVGVPPADRDPQQTETVDAGPAERDAGDVDPAPVFQSAVAAVVSAHAVANSIDGLLYGARDAGDEEAVTTLSWMKWQREPGSVDGDELADRLMERGDWRNARRVANWLIATRGESDRLKEIVSKSLERQFAEHTVVKVTPKRFPRLVDVDPGHRPALFLQDSEGARWAVWPDQGEDDWRGDIAVYRLCQLMVCHFEIPETRPMTMTRKTWSALIKSADESVAGMAKRLRSDFDFEKKVLHGSIRRLPTDAVPWPIEATSIWRPWLTTGSMSPTELAADAKDGHLRVAFLGAEKVLPELEGVNARQLARQISSMLLVDYLVGNWNRFAPREDQWGSRTWIDQGLIYSVDDSAAFLGDSSVRVKGRMSWSQRFSKATIDSLEQLEEDQVNDLLFPDADKAEREKLDRFWAQRRRALRRVGKLVKEYGAEDVFALDGPRKDNDGK